MCGIAGIVDPENRQQLALEDIQRFADSLYHRGPDEQGIWLNSNRTVALGHRRLKILDLSEKARQPFSSEDGRYRLIFNGEIYNFLEIREELMALGCSFRSESDTEVILASFIQWGPACQLKFNGMWAFGIWDEQQKRMFLSRDRFGVKPLYYSFDRSLFFASELKSFAYAKGFSAQMDAKTVALGIEFYNDLEVSEHSLVQGVKQLRPGHCLTFEFSGKLKIERWWSTLDHLCEVPDSWPDQVERFRETFFDSCKLRMRSDVPAAVALSGGLDSSSVLCVSNKIWRKFSGQKRTAKDLTAMVARFPGNVQDESSYAQETTLNLGISASFVDIEAGNALKYIEKILVSLESIDRLYASIWLLYDAYRRAGLRISLEGHGGDELLAGYRRRYSSLLKEKAPVLMSRRSNLEISSKRGGMRYRGFSWWSEENSKLFPYSMAATQMTFPQPRRDGLGPYFEDLQRIADFHPIDRQSYVDVHLGTLPRILRNFDRLSMAHGVEVRSPFLDWRIVCFLLSLPAESKWSGKQTKKILRESMTGLVPQSILARTTKQGFEDPWFEWLSGPFKTFVLDCISSRSFLQSAIWNGPAVLRLALDFYKDGCPMRRKSEIHFVWRCVQAFYLSKCLTSSAKKSPPHPQDFFSAPLLQSTAAH